jgi:hypothetical protein
MRCSNLSCLVLRDDTSGIENVEVIVRLAPPLPVRMSLETILSLGLGLGLRIGIATKLVPVTTKCTWVIVKMIGRGKTDSCAGYILQGI